jgi:NADPH:quinone reductase-like Zn-dependent oxidoreductase/short-subunit dehydrogenase/acyl carrier protein
VPSLRRTRDAAEQVRESLMRLYVQGVELDWAALSGGRPTAGLDLPTYPFQRQRYWVDSTPQRSQRQRTGHPLLGPGVHSPLLKETIYEAPISTEDPAWLTDHRVYGNIVFPGSAYFEMALAASGKAQPARIESLTIQEPLMLEEDREARLQTLLTPADDTHHTIQIISVEDGKQDQEPQWKQHASGRISLEQTFDIAISDLDLTGAIATFDEEIAVDTYYHQLREAGLDYGPTFCGLKRLLRRDNAALGNVRLPADTNDEKAYHLHPALLDSCFHVIGAALPRTEDGSEDDVFVPFTVQGLSIYRSGASDIWCAAEVTSSDQQRAQTVSVQLHLYDCDGAPVATVERLDLKRAPRSTWQHARPAAPLYDFAWLPQSRQAGSLSPGLWLICAPEQHLGAELTQRLEAAGATCVLATPGTATSANAEGHWHIDPHNPQAFTDLVAACAQNEQPWQGVIYLWGLAVPARPCSLDELHQGEAEVLQGALHLGQALTAQTDATPRLWLVTRGAQSIEGETNAPLQAALWGFGRTLANELPRVGTTCLDLDPAPHTALVDTLLAELQAAPGEDQIVLRSDHRLVARLTHFKAPAPAPAAHPYRLTFTERGSLDNLRFAPLERREPGPNEVEVEILATGLNFRDVLNVLGMYPGDPGPPGLECAGIVTAVGEGVTNLNPGDPVLGIVPQAFNDYGITSANVVVRKPSDMSFAEAATIPIAYLTAYYGLHHLAGMQAGERVLIHSAAGGVGMAAVQIAQHAGAEVYATAGSTEKHAVLRAMGVRHIYSSRTLDFADQIMADTNGAGVDIVLNALADEFISRSFAVLQPQGRFLEIGKRGIWSHEQVAATYPQVGYYPYDLADFLNAEPERLTATLQKIVDAIITGELQLLPHRAFSNSMLVDAFRFMAQARHIGKVVICQHQARHSPVRSDGAYLISGGLGGLGLEVARWLARHGAKRIALLGRRAPGEHARTVLAELEAAGTQVQIFQADVTDPAMMQQAVTETTADGTLLRGVIHAAGVLDDGVIEQQNWERFTHVLRPKVDGAWSLYYATHTAPLDFFVLFSSASALLGSAGQANYAAANAYLDGLAYHWRTEGLPALSINWGAWAEVGMAATQANREQQRRAGRGVETISIDAGLQALEQLIRTDAVQTAMLPIDWATLLAQMPETPPLLREIAVPSTATSAATAATSDGLMERIGEAATDERPALFSVYLQQAVMQVLGFPEPPGADQRLDDLGIDSLMAVELKNRIERDTGIALPVPTFLEGPAIQELAQQLADTTTTSQPQTTAAKPDTIMPDQLLANVDQLTDEEVAELLSMMEQQEQSEQ